MLSWLALLVLTGFVIYLDSRLRGLERRLEESRDEAEHRPPAQIVNSAPFEAAMAVASAELPEEEPRDDIIEEHWAQPVPEVQEHEGPKEPRWRALGLGFEDLFGRRLPIWAGGITLAVAGILIVKLSIDSGLLTPLIRVLSGLLFGVGLIAAAEGALRLEERVRDPRVRQALSGAGVATLYASILIAANLYRLIDPVTAMLGIAGVTALALFLATRFGAPSALLGLAGGLVAPALIGSDEPNVPLLSVYLALTVAGLCTLSRSQRWAWLGVSALIGGFGWGVILLIGGALDAPSSISLGLYLLLLGVGIPTLGFAGGRNNQLQLVAGIIAAAQMAVLVATGGFALLNWGLFAMLSIALIWLAQRDERLARLPAAGLLIALLLMGAWTSPDVGDFALVLSAFALIYATPAVLRLWRFGGLIEAAEIGALGLGALLLPMFHFHRSDGTNDLVFGLLALGLTFAVGACAALGWTKADRRSDARFALLGAVTAVLAGAAALLLLPIWVAGVALGLIGLMLLRLGQSAGDPRLEPIAWVFAAAGTLAYPYSQVADGTIYPEPVDLLHWALQATIAALFAWRAKLAAGRGTAQFLAPVFLYLAMASVGSAQYDPLIAPVLLVGIALIGRRLDVRLIPAMASCALIIFAWAMAPVAFWSIGAAASLVGAPMLVTDVPKAVDAITQLLIPGLAVGVSVIIAASRLRSPEPTIGLSLAGVLVTAGVHSLYKLVFAIASTSAFVSLALAERTAWELGLAGLAVMAWRLGQKAVGLILAVAAAGHLAFYTLLLHNPLWAEQAVGNWPVLNLLLPAYALAIALSVAAHRWLPSGTGQTRRAVNIVQMILIALFVFSTLRQLFHGTILVAPGLPIAEDILRSIVAIILALAFLLWGIARHDRDWRIASLVLMLMAVGKVFFFDASGLEGLARIASFLALGLSLIGIGWLYARHLNDNDVPGRPVAA